MNFRKKIAFATVIFLFKYGHYYALINIKEHVFIWLSKVSSPLSTQSHTSAENLSLARYDENLGADGEVALHCKNSSAMEVLVKIAVLTYIGAKTHSPARAGMLAHQGVLEHSPLQSTTATLLESPLVFKSDSLWHFPSEREKAAEKQGNPFQHLSHCSLQKWGHRKKKNYRMWLFKSVRKEHPPASSSSSEAFQFFCCAQEQILAAGFCFLVKKQDLPLSEAHGQHSGSLSLLAHYLKTPQWCSQFEAAEKTALLWHFMWNNHWNKQLQWHTVVGWR